MSIQKRLVPTMVHGALGSPTHFVRQMVWGEMQIENDVLMFSNVF